MKKHWFVLLAIAMPFWSQVQAKKVYVKLSDDTEAWSYVTQDDNNMVVTIPDGKFNGILGNILAGDVVWVAKGVYQLTGSVNVNGEREGAKIYGGFKGDETSLEQRSLIDCDENGIVEPWEFEHETRFVGNTEAEPSYRMFTINAAGDVLDGVTICDNTNVNDHGVGAFLKNGAVLSNCIIRNIKSAANKNSAVNGTGVFVDGNGLIKACLIENCENYNEHESGSTYGGGVNISGKTSVISNSVIRNNHVISSKNALGGGVFVNAGATMENCVVFNNSADYRGGGIYVHSGGGQLYNVTVAKNMGAQAGGGIFANGRSVIYNSVFWGNVNQQGNANSINLNQAGFVETTAYCGEQGAGIWMENKNLNESPVLYQFIELNDLTEEVTEGLAPRFIRPTVEPGIGYEFLEGTLEAIAKANWGLLPNSDLIDKGVNSIPDYTISATDMCGNSRPVGDKYDLGAYELGSGATGVVNNIQSDGKSYTFDICSNGVTVKGIGKLAKVQVYSATGVLQKTLSMRNGETIALFERGVYLLSIAEEGIVQSAKIAF